MPVYIWLTLAAILIIIEIFTSGFFIACFGFGALLAAGVAYITPSFGWQVGVFIVVSAIAIPFSRLLARKMSHDNIPQAGADALAGKIAVVTEDIVPLSNKGKIKVDGETWRALADREIRTGEVVKIISIKGTMLEVEKTEGEENGI